MNETPKIVQGFYKEQILGVDKMAYFSFRKVRTMALGSPQDFFQLYRPGAASEPATASMDMGRLIHMAVLEQKKFRERFVVQPSFTGLTKDGRESERSGEAQAKKKAWYEKLPQGSVVCSHEELDTIVDCVEMIMNYEPAKKLLTGGIAEGWGYVWDPIFGRFQLVRPDFISNDLITVDLKTTAKQLPSKRAWARQVGFDGNHIQLAHNARGVGLYRAGDNEKEVDRISRRGAWIVLKTSFPRAVAVYTANEQMMEAGLAKCFAAYHRINEMLEKDPEMTNRWGWPGKQTHAEEIGFEPWQLQDDEDYKEITQEDQP